MIIANDDDGNNDGNVNDDRDDNDDDYDGNVNDDRDDDDM